MNGEGRMWRQNLKVKERGGQSRSLPVGPALSISVCIRVCMAGYLCLPKTGLQPCSFVLTQLVLSLEPLVTRTIVFGSQTGLVLWVASVLWGWIWHLQCPASTALTSCPLRGWNATKLFTFGHSFTHRLLIGLGAALCLSSSCGNRTEHWSSFCLCYVITGDKCLF